MANQQIGRKLIIKRGSGSGPVVYTTLCGFKARSIVLNNNLVDVSVPDCIVPEGIVYAAVAAGIQQLQFSGSGIFDSDATSKALGSDVMNQVVTTSYQITIPGLGVVTGVFVVDSITYSGSEQGNLEFEATFRSNGTLTWAPDP